MTKHCQIEKKSGANYHFNLDSVSMVSLAACQEWSSKVFSNSVIVRRALRQYRDRLDSAGRHELEFEVVQARRAAQGIV